MAAGAVFVMKKEKEGQQIGLAKRDNNLALVDDPNFDRKLDLIIAGANPYLKEHLHNTCKIDKQD
jgi:hypothetical protein